MTLNDYGDQKSLVEACQKIDIRRVMKSYQASLRQGIKDGALDVNGVLISLVESRTGNGGIRFWFKCPTCSRRVGVIYQSLSWKVGCRTCLKLDYRSHRYKGMIEDSVQ